MEVLDQLKEGRSPFRGKGEDEIGFSLMEEGDSFFGVRDKKPEGKGGFGILVGKERGLSFKEEGEEVLTGREVCLGEGTPEGFVNKEGGGQLASTEILGVKPEGAGRILCPKDLRAPLFLQGDLLKKETWAR